MVAQSLQELKLQGEAGAGRDGEDTGRNDDAIDEPDSVEDVLEPGALPPVPTHGLIKKSKTEALKKLSLDHKKLRDMLEGSGGETCPHFEAACPIWWQEIRNNVHATEGCVLLPAQDQDPWYEHTFLTEGGISELPHVDKLVRVSKTAAVEAHQKQGIEEIGPGQGSPFCNCQRGVPAFKMIIEKLVRALPKEYGGLLISVLFSGVRDVSVAAHAVRIETSFDIRVLEYEARDAFWSVGRERLLQVACADFNTDARHFSA